VVVVIPFHYIRHYDLLLTTQSTCRMDSEISTPTPALLRETGAGLDFGSCGRKGW
jgi:hypothetical protein